MTILILGGDNFQALRLSRDLGKCHNIYVGGVNKRQTLASWSRFTKGHLSFKENQPYSNDELLKAISVLGIELIIPTTERACIFLNIFRGEIESLGALMACDKQEKLEIAFDKLKTFKFCRANNILTPNVSIGAPQELKGDKVVLKARSSNVLDKNGVITRSVSPKYLPKERAISKGEEGFFFQELIRGRSIGYFALCKSGEVLLQYSHERILDTNPSGSGSCVRRSKHNMTTALTNISIDILRKLQWTGPIMLEYVMEDKSEDLYLLEINGRLWGSYCLSTYSGIPFSEQLVALYSSKDLKKSFNAVSITVTNELLLISRWLRILRGPTRYSSDKFPSRRVIFKEIKFILSKKELLSDFDPLPILRFLWRK